MEALEMVKLLGTSLGLGLLVGLERERSETRVAGFRTFALVTLTGTICGLLAQVMSGWIVAAGLLGVAAVVLVARHNEARGRVARHEAIDPGVTTETAALLMFGVGAYLVFGQTTVAVAIGIVTALLLHLKPTMHAFARRMGQRDMRAILQFTLVAFVILPVLPDQAYGPFEVLNPREIWFMVVLIAGINLAGYVLYKLFGRDVGLPLGGMIGGLASSTATTVSYSRRAQSDEPTISRALAVGIMLASTVLYVRVFIEVSAVDTSFLPAVALPLGIMLGFAMLTVGAFWWWSHRRAQGDFEDTTPDFSALTEHEEDDEESDAERSGDGDEPPDAGEESEDEQPDAGGADSEGDGEGDEDGTSLAPKNPAELPAALIFAVIYAVVKFAVAAVNHYLDDSWLYLVALVSGLTDVDAITLSTSRLVEKGRIEADTGWRLILVGAMANLVFKGGICAVLGGRRLTLYIGVMFGASIVLGTVLLFVL